MLLFTALISVARVVVIVGVSIVTSASLMVIAGASIIAHLVVVPRRSSIIETFLFLSCELHAIKRWHNPYIDGYSTAVKGFLVHAIQGTLSVLWGIKLNKSDSIYTESKSHILLTLDFDRVFRD